MKRKLALALVALVAPASLPARCCFAQSQSQSTPTPRVPFRLRWNAPPECPSRGEVVAQVARLIHRVPDTPADAPLSADAEVSCSPGHGCAMDMETISNAGSARRVFDGHDCAEVSSAAALIVALALEPDFSAEATTDTERPPPLGAVENPPSATLRSHPRPAPPSESPGPPGERTRPYFHAGTGIDVGSLPSPAPSAHAAMGIAYGPLRVEMAGTFLQPQRATIRAGDSSGIEIMLFEIETRACGRVVRGRLEYGACGAAGAGSMHGRAVNVSGPGEERGSPWVALLAGTYASVRLYPWLSVHGSVELGAAVMAPRFEISTPNGTFGYGPPTIFARATLTAEVALP